MNRVRWAIGAKRAGSAPSAASATNRSPAATRTACPAGRHAAQHWRSRTRASSRGSPTRPASATASWAAASAADPSSAYSSVDRAASSSARCAGRASPSRSSARRSTPIVASSTSDQSSPDHRSSPLMWRIAATTPSTSAAVVGDPRGGDERPPPGHRVTGRGPRGAQFGEQREAASLRRPARRVECVECRDARCSAASTGALARRGPLARRAGRTRRPLPPSPPRRRRARARPTHRSPRRDRRPTVGRCTSVMVAWVRARRAGETSARRASATMPWVKLSRPIVDGVRARRPATMAGSSASSTSSSGSPTTPASTASSSSSPMTAAVVSNRCVGGGSCDTRRRTTSCTAAGTDDRRVGGATERDERLDEERVTGRAGVHLVDQLLGPAGQPAADVGPRQAAEVEAQRIVLQRGEAGVHRRPGDRVVGAHRDDERRAGRQVVGEPAEHLEGRGVAPLQIVDDEHERATRPADRSGDGHPRDERLVADGDHDVVGDAESGEPVTDGRPRSRTARRWSSPDRGPRRSVGPPRRRSRHARAMSCRCPPGRRR